MTYDELVNAKGGLIAQTGKMPYGMLAKQQIDGKYREVLVIDKQWAAIPAFCDGLKADSQFSQHLQAKQQMHYEVMDDADGLKLILEPGSYQTLGQALDANPALVAKSGFVDGLVAGLLAVMGQLHEKSVCHLCFSPRNILIRKGDDMPLLLLHGSAFKDMRNVMRLFDGMEDFVAPELKEGGEFTAQNDIYSLGRLIEHLFLQGNLPYEYKRVVDKATQADPQKRYASAKQMEKHLENLRGRKRSLKVFVAALVVVLACVGLYFELTPQPEDIEFIEGAPKKEQYNMLDDGFDPDIEMTLMQDSNGSDSVSAEEQELIDRYMQKAEDIYRRRFAEQADGILSKVYNQESMNGSEKSFLVHSSSMSQELIELQTQLAEEMGISDASASRIATEVINGIIAQKSKNIKSEGVILDSDNDE